MISLVLTNRNRDLDIVRKCLESLKKQSEKSFDCFMVDYGSDENYLNQLKEFLQKFPEIKFISCPVSGQLWNKSRAINIALKQIVSPYFLVGDIDMLFSPVFFERINEIKNEEEIWYFKVGFLNKNESLRNLNFNEYQPSFHSNAEATGITLFPTQKLKDLNGYDEFYHGWGAEDTDVHIRMKNAGVKVSFYDSEILVKHQWHPKYYRSKESKQPFHNQLERINHYYLLQTKSNTNRIKANCNIDFGKMPLVSEYQKLKQKIDNSFKIDNSQLNLEAVLSQITNFSDETISLTVISGPFLSQIKNSANKLMNKKYIPYLSMEDINNRLLLEIINKYRNNAYCYTFDRKKNTITVIIHL